MTRQRFRQVMPDKAWQAWRIEHDLVWPLGFVAVLLLTTGMANGLVDELAYQQAAVLRSAQVGHELQNLSQSTVDVESGTRGLALTGDQAFLASASTAVPEARACLARLRSLTVHDPLASASIDALAQVVELRLQHALAVQARVIAGKVTLQSDCSKESICRTGFARFTPGSPRKRTQCGSTMWASPRGCAWSSRSDSRCRCWCLAASA